MQYQERGLSVRWIKPQGSGKVEGVILRIHEFRDALWRSHNDSPLRTRIERHIREDRRKLARMLLVSKGA